MGRYLFFVLVVILTSGMVAAAAQSVSAQAFSDGNRSDGGGQTTINVRPYKKGLTAGRARALTGGFIGILSLIVGRRAKRRPTKDQQKRNLAITAISLGAIGVILSIIHLIVTAGAVFGSGSGKAGAIIALIPGFGGIVLGLVTLRKQKD